MKRSVPVVLAVLGWSLLVLVLLRPAPDSVAFAGDEGGVAGLPPCPADLNGDQVVDVTDLVQLILAWGPCPPECVSGAECDDGNACTTDTCVAGNCQYMPIAGCCQNNGDCPSVPNGIIICSGANQCDTLLCNSGWLNCDGNILNGCEVDSTSDPDHCGGCNLDCPPGFSCENSACTAFP